MRLREIPGIQKWTAHYVAMCVLRDPDAFPSGDLALLRAMGEQTRGRIGKAVRGVASLAVIRSDVVVAIRGNPIAARRLSPLIANKGNARDFR